MPKDKTTDPAPDSEATATDDEAAAWGQDNAPEAAEEAPVEEGTPGPQEYERLSRETTDASTTHVDAGGSPTK